MFSLARAQTPADDSVRNTTSPQLEAKMANRTLSTANTQTDPMCIGREFTSSVLYNFVAEIKVLLKLLETEHSEAKIREGRSLRQVSERRKQLCQELPDLREQNAVLAKKVDQWNKMLAPCKAHVIN